MWTPKTCMRQHLMWGTILSTHCTHCAHRLKLHHPLMVDVITISLRDTHKVSATPYAPTPIRAMTAAATATRAFSGHSFTSFNPTPLVGLAPAYDWRIIPSHKLTANRGRASQRYMRKTHKRGHAVSRTRPCISRYMTSALPLSYYRTPYYLVGLAGRHLRVITFLHKPRIR